MHDYWTRKIINTILLCLFVIGIALVIWEAIPTIIKILAVIGVIGYFLKIITSK